MSQKKQPSLFSFWNSSKKSNSNRTPARNNNSNNNQTAKTKLTPEVRALIEAKRQAALERRRQRQLQNQQTPQIRQNISSTLTPAINKIRMTPNNNRNNQNHNSSHTNGNFNNNFSNNNNNRTPLSNTTNTASVPLTNNNNNNNNSNPSATRTSTRKRTRKQYIENDSDDSPVQPRKKVRRSNIKRKIPDSDDDYNPVGEDLQPQSEDYSEHSPSASPKRKNRNRNSNNRNSNNHNSNNNLLFEEQEDNISEDNDIDIDNNNTNISTIRLDDTEIDALERIGAFELYDSDDERKNEPIKRDSKYTHKNYNDYKRKTTKRINDANKAMDGDKKKPAGASHRDVSQYEWYKNPTDFKGRPRDHPNNNATQILVPKSFFNDKKMTNSQKQYWRIKSTHADGILFFKVGKFYEIYYQDADIGHKLTGLAYMGGESPHVGFPEKSFNKYAESFVRHGYKIYRVEQTQPAEEARKNKTIVRREVCETISKGTIVPEEFLDDRANFILSIVEEEENKNTSSIDVGVCYMDFSIGSIYIGRFIDDRNRSRLRTLMYQINASEIVYKKGRLTKETESLIKMDSKDAEVTKLVDDEQFYGADKTKSILESEKYWKDKEDYPDVLKTAWGQNLTMHAFGGILYMLQATMHDHEILPHSTWGIYDPSSTKCAQFLTLDGSTLGNLEILRTEDGSKRGTLIEFVDHCQTKFGKRMMEHWLRAPLNQLEAINERLDAVEYLIEESDYWIDTLCVTNKLSELPDLERLLHNLAVLGTKNRKMDKAIMFESCWNEAKVKKLLSALDGFDAINELFNEINKNRDNIASKLINDITTIIEHNEMDEEEKKNDRNILEFGSIIRHFRDSFEVIEEGSGAKTTQSIQPVRGKEEEFDAIMDKIEENCKKLDKILGDIRKEYRSNKIEYYHKKNGKIKDTYLIAIPKGLNADPCDEWHLKSETAKVTRYHTDEILLLLKDREEYMNDKEDLIRDASRATFARFAKHGVIWKKIVNNIGILDCLLSLANISQNAANVDMVRPEFIAREKNGNAFLEIRECKHPCVGENGLNVMGQQSGASTFIPNDTVLGAKENVSNFVIVTGPNMGGKSTLLRQTCVAVILAHIGCYVPCKAMRLTPVDRIFTRVGANDRILAGQSTFMVELEETSNVLRHATSNSLVILDELGRGTSTFDGTAIAYAVAKQLIDEIECRCLFSTHYHGLCDSFVDNPKVAMYHMNFKESEDGDTITFLYKFTQGICKNSHGINCAKLAFDKDRFKDMLEMAQQKANMLHDRMHSEQDLSEEKELIHQFKGLMSAMIQENLWTKIQADIAEESNRSG